MQSHTLIGQGTMKSKLDSSFPILTDCYDTEIIIGENRGFTDVIFQNHPAFDLLVENKLENSS